MGKINPIRVYCIAEEFDFNRLSQYLSDKTNSTVIKDTILYKPSTGGTALFFKSGVLVFWDVDFDTQKYILESIRDYLVGHYNKPISEDFSYMVECSQTGFKISRDIIYLTEETDLIKMAVSYPLAQSTKLYRFEESISDIIKRNEFIPYELSLKGKITLSKSEISKERGRIFLERTEIYLNLGFLDTPEFFWEFSDLEKIYEAVSNYLDIKPRVEILNKKMEIIQDLLTMLSNEQNHLHSAFLETVIIILIAIEIIISIVKW